MALSGDSFCASAWSGFLINIKHGFSFIFANLLANILIFFGKIAITIANCYTLYLFTSFGTSQTNIDLNPVFSISAPMVIVGVTTYITSSVFLGVFEEAVIALMMCKCIDIDLNG